MKALGMMHSFLDLEVWQNPNDIVLSQGKYTVEILKRFRMMDWKSVTMPMTTNLKLLSDTSLETMDATLYRTNNWFVDVLGKHEARYMLCG